MIKLLSKNVIDLVIMELQFFRNSCVWESFQLFLNCQNFTMSSYEDYSKVSEVYDKERLALGADVVAGLLHVYGGKPLKVGNLSQYVTFSRSWII